MYESPKRAGALLADAAEVLGAERQATLCRELTKKFEETRHGTLQELADYYATATVKGEVVVLIGRADVVAVSEIDIESALELALRDMSVKDAAAFVAETFDVPKRQVYQQALAMSRD